MLTYQKSNGGVNIGAYHSQRVRKNQALGRLVKGVFCQSASLAKGVVHNLIYKIYWL